MSTMPLGQNVTSPYSDACLLNRVRDSVRGNDVIDWAENEFEPFLELFDVIRLDDGDASNLKDGSIYLNTLSDMIRMHSRSSTSHVLFTHLNENWGGFSTTVPNRSIDWGHWDSKMLAEGCSRQVVKRYLDDPNVRSVVTPQHTAICHPSILSIPIGIQQSQLLLEQLRNADGAKTQELLINNSGWKHRKQINATVIANFGWRLTNSYGVSQTEYYQFIARSRFVLCPPGLGCDSYRLWETLLLGSIPIVERSPGWDSLLDDLPVLLVSSFDQVTPELLDSAYPKILSKCDCFQFDKLTKQWWVSKINELLRD
jgi:hypothetical protein